MTYVEIIVWSIGTLIGLIWLIKILHANHLSFKSTEGTFYSTLKAFKKIIFKYLSHLFGRSGASIFLEESAFLGGRTGTKVVAEAAEEFGGRIAARYGTLGIGGEFINSMTHLSEVIHFEVLTLFMLLIFTAAEIAWAFHKDKTFIKDSKRIGKTLLEVYITFSVVELAALLF